MHQNPVEHKDFKWLLTTLPPSLLLKLPETLFFSHCQPQLFIYPTASGSLKSSTSLKMNSIISLFIRKVHKRKRPPARISSQVALLRFHNNTFQVIENDYLASLLTQKQLPPSHCSLLYIQGLTNCQSPLTSISTFDYNEEEPPEVLKEHPIAVRIVEGLKEKKYRLIRAKFEFIVDDDAAVWLGFVSGIEVQRQPDSQEVEIKIWRMPKGSRKEFLESINSHARRPKSGRLLSLQIEMNEGYKLIKKDLNIDQALRNAFNFEMPQLSLPSMIHTSHDPIFSTCRAKPTRKLRVVKRSGLTKLIKTNQN